MPKIKEKRIRSFDGTHISYYISRGKGPCLFFIHGLGLDHTSFKKEQHYFSNKGFTTVNIDVRGHGESETNRDYSLDNRDYSLDNRDYSLDNRDCSLEAFAKDAYAVLKKESVNEAVLIGHSFGGFIALQFYKMFSKAVKAMILIGASYKLSLITIRPSFLLFDFLPFKILATMPLLKHKKNEYLGEVKYKTTLKSVYESPFAADRQWIGNCIGVMRQAKLKEVLGKIRVPVLIVETSDDEIFSRLSYRIMHKKIKKSKLDLIAGCHAIPLRNPQLLDKEISKFLKSVL